MVSCIQFPIAFIPKFCFYVESISNRLQAHPRSLLLLLPSSERKRAQKSWRISVSLKSGAHLSGQLYMLSEAADDVDDVLLCATMRVFLPEYV